MRYYAQLGGSSAARWAAVPTSFCSTAKKRGSRVLEASPAVIASSSCSYEVHPAAGCYCHGAGISLCVYGAICLCRITIGEHQRNRTSADEPCMLSCLI
jgi:hypothetical protein